MSNKTKVSICVPVYNVSRYIERCARSVFEQTYPNLEIVFVDDCSPDDSMNILQRVLNDYPDRKPQTVFKRHLNNRGLAASRNTGLDVATGDYIMFVDSDDWIDDDCVARLLEKAVATNSDIVYCDFYKTELYGETYISQYCGRESTKCVEAMLNGKMQCMMWNKIYRRSLFVRSGIRWIDGADMHEDVGVNVRLFAVASGIDYLKSAFYHYVQYNASSILRQAEMGGVNKGQVVCNVSKMWKRLLHTSKASKCGVLPSSVQLPTANCVRKTTWSAIPITA